jgi:hypothetical protein
MLVYPDVRNRVLSNKSALLLLLMLLNSACTSDRSPLDTQSRTVYMGETKESQNAVSKIKSAKCTEPPPSSYSESVRLRLDAALKLSRLPASDAAKLAGEFSKNIKSYFKTSQEGEDLKAIRFYICQISNNRNFSNDVTEKLIGRTIEAYANRSPRLRQHSAGSNSPNLIGNKSNVAIMTPADKVSGQADGVRNELKGSLSKVVLEGYTLKADIEREYRLHRREETFEANSKGLTKTWSLKVTSWAGKAEDILQKIDPVAKGEFRAYHGLPLSRAGGDEKWGNIDYWLNGKLDFLSRFSERIGKSY